MGTPHYMSPEMLRGEKVDGRADIYALGLTAFHLLAGRPPYEAPSSIALTVKQLSEPLPSLAKLAPSTPPSLCRLVERMSEKDRDKRIATCRQVIEALDAIRAGQSTAAAPAARRPPVTLIAVGALVLTAGVGAGVALHSRHPDSRQGKSNGGTGVVIPESPKSDKVASPVPEVAGPLRVAVLKFKNLGGEAKLNGLVEGIGETVIMRSPARPDVTLVERNQVDQAIQEIDFGLTKYVDKKTAAALGQMAGVSVAVQGGFQTAGGQIRVNARLVRVATGEIVDSLVITQPESDLFAAQDAVAAELKRRLVTMAARK